MKTKSLILAVLPAIFSFSACSSTTTPAGAGGGGSAPEGTFANVQAIFNNRCVNCHDASLPPAIPYDPTLSLVPGDAYAALVNTPANATCGGTRVIPGAPDQSFLMKKIEPGTPCYGSHMPRPFEVGPALNLTATELQTIEAWISDGAMP
ncbi:MAG TPA: hypothetical protein PK156_06240 [Polyangium sp.]|nr:hypothetical protein [Polyangium sp.]